jgi:hypothetical protein
MGKFSDTLKEYNLSPELTGAVGTAESIYGTVSGAAAFYGTAYSIGEKLGLWGGGPNDFDRLTTAIQNLVKAMTAGFQAVLVGQHLQEEQAKVDSMIELQAHALEQLNVLKTVPPSGQLTPAERLVLETQTDCQAYLDDGYWNFVYYTQLAHTDAWSGTLEPPHSGNLYLGYTIMLPRYLQAIGIRITALVAAYPHPFISPQPDGTAGFHDDLVGHAGKLAAVHNAVRQAIVPLRTPTTAEMLHTVTAPKYDTQHTRYWTLSPSAWENSERLFGAVELYSTTDSIATYPESAPPPPSPADFPVEPNVPEYVPPPNPNAPNYKPPVSHLDDYQKAFEAYAANFKTHYYPVFAARHAALTLQKQKVVYNNVGLGRLWSAMNRLRLIAGEAPLRVGDPGDVNLVREGTWSMREFSQRLAAAVGSVASGNLMIPVAALPLTIRSLGFLVGIPSASVGSLRQVFLDLLGAVP